MRIARLLSALACATVLASVVRAEPACAPLTIVTSVDMHLGSDGRIYVPVTIGDVQKSMLVDTGGLFSTMTQAMADDLKLSMRHTRLKMIGVSGDTTDLAVRTGFTLGKLHADSMDFMVMGGTDSFASDMPDAAGILGPNILTSYDLDLDFGARKLNLLSQDHCEGKVIYWPAAAVAVIPVRIDDTGHIVLPVVLDGRNLTATLDTGASNSVLNLVTATTAFPLALGSPDTPATGALAGAEGSKTYSHRFKSLALEGIAIGNPTMEIIPDLMRNKMDDPAESLNGGSRIPDRRQQSRLPDMILGMNILHRLHVYIAYKEQTLYITPASAPVEKTTAGPATDPPH